MSDKKKMSLEETMSRLEEIVGELEGEKLPLEKSLKLYEEGIKLVGQCSAELEAARRKIQILQQGKNGEIELVEIPEATFADEI